ncbi:MAG: hypothetical protein JW700_00395, partial [Candidatus Aenigmarchaeota archaeon]|nr:hypothetical protein [Candidatus Aenigmarchaeota archaeon]
MSSRNSKKTEDSLSFDSTLSNHNVMNYVQGPFYSELSPGLRMSREKSSYANFLVNTAKYDKETVKNIAKDTTIHEIKRLYKRKEFEGASIDPAKNGNGVLSNIVTASMFDHLPQNQDDLEDYFLDLQKNDPERFKREYQSFCDVFSSVVEGVDEGEKYSLLMGGLAPQQEVEERKKDRYERKKEKPGWFRRQIRAHPKAAVASFLGVGGLVVATPFIAPLVNNYISNNSNNNSNNNNGVVVTGTDSDGDGLTDIEEETIYHTDPDNPDSDTDFIL